MRSLQELVDFIRVSCKNQDSSITKMEKSLKFANGTVGKWANGKRNPPNDKLELVAEFLGISLDELLGNQKEKPVPENRDRQSEFDELFEQMNDKEQNDVIKYMKFICSQRESDSL